MHLCDYVDITITTVTNVAIATTTTTTIVTCHHHYYHLRLAMTYYNQLPSYCQYIKFTVDKQADKLIKAAFKSLF
jgi:hypothetical protein